MVHALEVPIHLRVGIAGRLNEQQAVRLQCGDARPHRGDRVQQMLEHVIEDDGVERAGGEVLLLDRAGQHRDSERSLRVVYDPRADLEADRIEPGIAQHAHECAVRAADVPAPALAAACTRGGCATSTGNARADRGAHARRCRVAPVDRVDARTSTLGHRIHRRRPRFRLGRTLRGPGRRACHRRHTPRSGSRSARDDLRRTSTSAWFTRACVDGGCGVGNRACGKRCCRKSCTNTMRHHRMLPCRVKPSGSAESSLPGRPNAQRAGSTT